MKPCHDWVDPNSECTDNIQQLVHNWDHQQVPVPEIVIQQAPVRATVLQ